MHQFNRNKNIVVIGGNAAGAAAAANAKRNDPDANVSIFEKSAYISTGTCELPYVLSGEICDYKKIIFFDEKTFKQEKGVNVFINHKVVQIEREKKKLVVRDLKLEKEFEVDYDKLILATGSESNRIRTLEPGAENLFKFKNIDDLLRLNTYLEETQTKNAVIVGSGYIGLEVCESLKSKGLELTLIEKKQLPLPESETEIQKIISKILNEKNIRFIGSVGSIIPNTENNLIKSLNVDGRFIDSPVVIVCAGFKPDTELAQHAKIKTGDTGAVAVNNRLQTNDPDIYAAGDCIEIKNFITGKSEYLPLATLAYQQGKTTGKNVAGGNKIYGPVIKNTAVKIFENVLIQVGLTEKQAIQNKINYISASAITKNLVDIMPKSRTIFGKLIAEKFSGNLIGASFWGTNDLAPAGDMICLMIKNKMHFNNLREIEFNYTPPVSPMHNILSILEKKMAKVKND